MVCKRKIPSCLRDFIARAFIPYAVLRSCICRLVKDERGVSAVEFALLLPVMVIIYAGVADVSRGVEVNRKVNRVASMVGDLLSKQINVTPSQLDDIFNIGATVMAPSGRAPEIRISFVKVEQKTVTSPFVVKLDWSHKTPGFDTDKGADPIDLPENLRKEVINYIRIDTQYKHIPFTSYIVPSLSMAETYFVSPRYTDAVLCATCGS
ncbi:pilus assembly protein [Pseudochrobactrum sp. sp1633]|uniref:TadE/TadG family type IV pilus assembly protein n=1 Tax=Pseudochrobactrum sp. sp1633 TaxID=3036706 RepID=UPI0025A4FA64|nr:TadE/TadG family type IV pilus assembly protein [Pseudochrobactrum sp. sp1633]MDM8344864.1 pilus assembly protein [Pseudochrobactrum sp. sp1633]HWD14697.1 TadE/TadG family type IV pilus assembly protein [Pseudochrobactrum sp.]